MPAGSTIVDMEAFKTKRGRRHDVEGFYAKVPLPLIAEAVKATTTPLRLVVFIYLLCWLRLKGNPVQVNIAQLQAMGISRRTVYRALQEFQDAGLISVDRRRGRLARVTFLREVYR
jgi:CRP-like cAMP-binding protein